jgi:anaerobic selenocysteine-containing dehydrogenase/Fe-S-cluster-containing dehydrogenase component
MSQPTAPSGVKRRDFLKVLGAAGAATTTVGCFQEQVEQLIPYLNSPDQTVPGVSTHYSTTCRECALACGVIAETRDGRAIKLEGNPEHPVNRGALCARGQSALQGLYNPDRYRGPMIRENNRLVPATWDRALQTFSQRLGQVRSGGQAANAVFINQHENGSFPAFLDQWLAGFGMPPHIAYDAEADLAVAEANQQSYGVAWPAFDFTAARLIVSIGANFLEGWGASIPQQLSFADARGRLQGAPRFVYIGARRSLTGLNADQWIPARPGSELAVAQALQASLGGGGTGSMRAAAEASGVDEAVLTRLAEELRGARPSLVLAGVSSGDAREIALAVNGINRAAGNVGVTIKLDQAYLSLDGASGIADLAALTQRLTSGAVPLIMVRGANPVYSLPQGLGFAAAFARAGFKVSFSSIVDETSELCDLVLPDHHSLESWGDAEPMRGVLGMQQPVMDPVFASRATADVLIGVAKSDPSSAARYPFSSYREWLMSRHPGGQAGFTSALARGLASGSAMARSGAQRAAPTPTLAQPVGAQQGEYFVLVYPSPVLGDGRGANKPWLQELPDPVTKIAWQSVVEIHPLTAQRLGIHSGDHVRVETSAGNITAPAYPFLGVRQDTVAIALGQGHTGGGRYAQGVGVNALDLLTPGTNAAGGHAHVQLKGRVTRAEGKSPLVSTEGSARQHGRGIAQAITAADLAAGRTEAEHHELPGDAEHEFLPGLRSPIASDAIGELSKQEHRDSHGMYDPNHWSGMAKRRWAMTIDLARCTGCSACVTACYAENNIPTVGARWQGRSLRPFHSSDGSGWDTRPGANILKGREMAWLRLERYYEGGEDGTSDFEARFVPMMCQHCGNAPCEPVCPVYATYHSPDGLNVQVYNRCVGTRYCSNGCPYKVRYFNWHGFGEPARRQYAFPEPLHLQLNPDVTVRGKGVMEKCTFCVQRIREAENLAKLENREVRPDEFTTACAQACPSRAITFGDAAHEEWSVARMAEDARAYHVLHELNTFTAVVYLKKVTHAAGAAPAAGGVR